MLEDPAEGCREIRFAAPLVLDPAAEIALEDYARVLTRARHAEVRHGAPLAAGEAGGRRAVVGVHLCDPDAPCDGPPAADVEAFAREMVIVPEASGLGWS